jgi:hypothetical protein
MQNTEDHDKLKGLYYATSVMRMVLNNAPRLFFGERPETMMGRMLSWSAPLASNIMGMYINSTMRQDAIETNKQNIKDLHDKFAALEKQVKNGK